MKRNYFLISYMTMESYLQVHNKRTTESKHSIFTSIAIWRCFHWMATNVWNNVFMLIAIVETYPIAIIETSIELKFSSPKNSSQTCTFAYMEKHIYSISYLATQKVHDFTWTIQIITSRPLWSTLIKVAVYIIILSVTYIFYGAIIQNLIEV